MRKHKTGQTKKLLRICSELAESCKVLYINPNDDLYDIAMKAQDIGATFVYISDSLINYDKFDIVIIDN